MSFRLASLVLLLVFAGCQLVHGHIYLDWQGSQAWNGECSETNCTSASPCSVSRTMANSASGHGCEIILLSASWNTISFDWESSTSDPVVIYLRSSSLYFSVQFAFKASNITVKSFSLLVEEEPTDFGTPATLQTNSFLKFTSVVNAVLEVDGVVIESGSKLMVVQENAAAPFLALTFKNLTYNAESSPSTPMIEFSNIYGLDLLVFDHCMINGTGPNPPQNLIAWNAGSTDISSLVFQDSEFYGRDLFHPMLTISLQSLTWTRSTFNFTGSLLQNGQPISWVITDCEVLGSNVDGGYPLLLSGSTAGINFAVRDSTIREVQIPSTGIFRISYSTIIDIKLDTEAVTQWIGVNITLSSTSASITIHGNSVPPAKSITMASCTINSGPGSVGKFALDRYLEFAPASDLQISWLSLGTAGSNTNTNVTFSNLTVSQGVQGLSTSAIEMRALPNAVWTWPSLAVDDTVVVDLSNLHTFNYIATYPDNGIQKVTRFRPPNYYPFHLSSTSNISINVIWDPITANDPQYDIFYPIMQLGAYASGDVVAVPSSRPYGPHEPQFKVEITTLGKIGAYLTSLAQTPIAPLTCPQPYPPGFTCVNGVLFAPGNVQGEVITLPPNVGVVNVNGSLDSSKSIVFEGLGTTLNVSGCVTLGSDGILIDLSKNVPSKGSSELETKVGQEYLLISQAENCQPILAANIEVNSPSGCKKFDAKNGPTSTNARLTVVFQLDSGKCNTKWIILGSVLGGVVVIAVISLVLLVTFNRSAREFFRPHSRKRRTYS